MMSSIIFLTLIGWSTTNLIVNGPIFDFIKSEKFGVIARLFSCMMCTGFWVGFAGSLLLEKIIQIPEISFFGSLYIDAFSHGIFISGFSVIINSFLVYLIKK